MEHAKGCACLSEEWRSEIRQTGRGMHRGMHVCKRSDQVKYGRLIGRGMQRDVHVSQRSDKLKYGRPIGRGMQRGTHVCQRSNMQRMVRIISIYYCWIFSLLILYLLSLITRQDKRPCHLLSHVVHNSKLTTLPQSQRRWQPSWQRMLEARQIIERIAKDPVTLFHNMSFFIWGMHRRSEISPVPSCLVHEEKLSLKFIEQCNFVITFIQWKDDGWLGRGGWDGLDYEVYLFIDSCQLRPV